MNETQIVRGSDLEMASSLISYLKNSGIAFDRSGFPVFQKHWFLTTLPDEILPFARRRNCMDKRRTALCFFCDDTDLYPRFRTVFKDLPTYKEYQGILFMDVSVSRYMLDQVQSFNYLLNALFMAVLGVNGVSIVPSIRFGSFNQIPNYRILSNAEIWCVGCIGTKRNSKDDQEWENRCREAFLLIAKPKVILAYGLMNGGEMSAWNLAGVPVRQYADYQSRSRKGVFDR